MALAMMYPEPADASKNAIKNKAGSATEPVPDVGKDRLSMARTVLCDSRALAEKVMAVAMMLPVGAAFFSLPHRRAVLLKRALINAHEVCFCWQTRKH